MIIIPEIPPFVGGQRYGMFLGFERRKLN